MLTTGVDNINGTAGNDTIIADNTGTDPQLTAADQVNGGAGVDTVKIYQKAATDLSTTVFGTMTNVEKVYINSGALTDTKTLDVSGMSAVTGLTLDSPAAMGNGHAFTIKTTATQDVSLTKVNGTGTGGNNSTVNLNGASTVTVNAVGTTAGTLTLDLTSTGTALTLNTTGAASTVTLANTGAKLSTLTIAGDKELTLTESVDGLKTINASAATAAVKVNASGATIDKTFAFTGGSANDVLTVKAGALSTAGFVGSQIDMGAGTDTLVINDTAPAAADYTAINAIKGLEIVQAGANNTTFDMSKLTLNKVAFATAQGTATNLESTDTVLAYAAMGTSLTMGGAVGNSTANLVIGNESVKAAAGFTIASLVTTGLTNVNIKSTGDGTAANVITAMTNNDNSNVVITGANDLTMALAAGTATGSKVDANAFTGKLAVTGSGFADVIIGGSGADTITGGAGADTITGGAGADNFVLTNTTDGGIDWIKDFVAGTDKIFTTNNATATTKVLAIADKGALSTTTYATLNDAVATFAAAGVNATEALKAYTFTYGSDTYLIVDNGTAGYLVGTDTLVKITGISGTLTVNDIFNA